MESLEADPHSTGRMRCGSEIITLLPPVPTSLQKKKENSFTELAHSPNLEVPDAFVDASSPVSLNPSLHLRMARSSFHLLGKKLSQRKKAWLVFCFIPKGYRFTGCL